MERFKMYQTGLCQALKRPAIGINSKGLQRDAGLYIRSNRGALLIWHNDHAAICPVSFQLVFSL